MFGDVKMKTRLIYIGENTYSEKMLTDQQYYKFWRNLEWNAFTNTALDLTKESNSRTIDER